MSKDNNLKIIRVPIPAPETGDYTSSDVNVYLIGNENESLLIDTGFDQEQSKFTIDTALSENNIATPSAIILTHAHPDHAPGVRQLTSYMPTIYCHRDEREEMKHLISPVNDLHPLRNKDVINISNTQLIVIHSPGHTKGHMSVYIPEEKVLLAGDNIIAEGTTWVGTPDGNMSDYLETLGNMKTLELRKIGPGHGDWILNPYEQIEFVLNRRLHREIQIKSFLQTDKKRTIDELTTLIYKNTIRPEIVPFAKRTIKAHLIKLIDEEIVLEENGFYFIKSR